MVMMLIKKLEYTLQMVDNYCKSIVNQYFEEDQIIEELKQKLHKIDLTNKFSQIISELKQWIENGKEFAEKLKTHVHVEQQQLQNKQSISQQDSLNSQMFKLDTLDQFIQNLEFISGAEQTEQNYVNQSEDQFAFLKENGIENVDFGNKLSRIKQYQRVRGDGNSFYTSFFFQYLQILLQSQSKSQKLNEFIQMTKEISLNLFFNGQPLIRTQQEIEIKCYFTKVFQELLKNPEKLIQYFSKNSKKFYICAIIIFRNYVYEIFQSKRQIFSQFLNTDLFGEIMTWQNEGNKMEDIIKNLCEALDLQVNLYLFTKNSCDVKTYNQNKNLNQINLLLREEHYQIAICNHQNYNN